MLESLLCPKDGVLADALRLINANGQGVVFVVDDENKLQGILTDGDIRRLLLNNISIGAPVSEHVNANCVLARKGESFEEMFARTDDRISIMPVVNDNHVVVDYFQYNRKVYLPIAEPDLKGNEFKYLMDAFISTWISSTGSYIKKFEDQFSTYVECEHGVAVSNGTVAIHLALVTLGIGHGDEVIIPDLTFAATINAVLLAGATPVMVDIEEDSWCIHPDEIEKAITSKTKAVIPVHLYGQPCRMDRIMEIAGKNDLYVIEDCAEAHGARFKGKRVGAFGHISTFSFFGNKVITTGEGGMCVTNDAALDDKMRVLRDHGMSKTKKYWHEYVGFNYRMTNLQAAIGVGQLERIEEILALRKKVEMEYRSLLSSFDFVAFEPDDLEYRERVTWLTSVLITNGKRDILQQELKAEGVDARPFFYPLGDMEIYSQYIFSNKVSRQISASGINFPSAHLLSDKIKQRIVKVFEKLL